MSDIATVIMQDPATGSLYLDWAMDGTDLQTDEGLQTSVYNSLFTDRQALPDDRLPSGETDHRGWWGDMPIDGTPPNPQKFIGSRLWLLSNAKRTSQTAAMAKHYCFEALKWIVDQGIAQAITVDTGWFAQGLAILNTITQKTAIQPFSPIVATSPRSPTRKSYAKSKSAGIMQYAYLWTPTRAQAMDAAIVAKGLSALGTTLGGLGTEGGLQLTTEDGKPILLEGGPLMTEDGRLISF